MTISDQDSSYISMMSVFPEKENKWKITGNMSGASIYMKYKLRAVGTESYNTSKEDKRIKKGK